jgi:hypothetical protein
MQHVRPQASRPALGLVSGFRRASLLDIPFLFDLYLDGSSSGSFTDKHLSGRGHMVLLYELFRSIVKSRVSPGSAGEPRGLVRFVVYVQDGQETGFVRARDLRTPDGRTETTILTCAIARSLRGTGTGERMIRRFIDESPGTDRFVAHCNKYARAMQRCLKRLHFVRQPHHPPQECYVLDPHEVLHRQVLDAALARHFGALATGT